MVEERGFVVISVPFVAGTALMEVLAPSGSLLYIAASSSQALSAILLILFSLNGKRQSDAALLFFSAGIMSWSVHALSASSMEHIIHSITMNETLSSLIDICGYSDKETSGLLKALLTGSRSHLDRSITADFREAGASHILALSGLHLGIIYMLIRRVFSFIGQSRAAAAARSIVTVTLCGAYSVITGASDSIIRAFIFICINESLKNFSGRRRRPESIFCAALMIHLALKPGSISQTGFQLSYLAMLGIAVLHPVLKSWYPPHSRWDIAGRIWDNASLALSCQIFTAPLVCLKFKTFPHNFLITNIVVMPLSEGLMICGLLNSAAAACGTESVALKNLTEMLGQAVIFCVKVIASIS